MKTAPFDLEKAKAGHPIITRDGRTPIIYTFSRSGNYCIVGDLQREASIMTWTDKGQYLITAIRKDERDLVLLLSNPTLRPWTSSEVPRGAWIKEKNGDGSFMIIGVDKDAVYYSSLRVTFDTLLDGWTLLDGSPCGVEI